VIARHWRGLAKAERAADYVRHLRSETFPALERLPGFVDAAILSRSLPRGVEFLILTRWESLAAIVRFAGADPQQAVVPPAVAQMMIEFDAVATHFEVL
jgi:heme-degrading monooxygenase HmoA